MSEQTKAALIDALRKHVSDEADDTRFLTDWYVIAASTDEDMQTTFYLHVCSDAPAHTLLGLTEVARKRMAAMWGDIDD